VRSDELRAGLATLAGFYVAQLTAANIPARRIRALEDACQAIDEATRYLTRNPNEALLLQSLFVRLGDLAG